MRKANPPLTASERKRPAASTSDSPGLSATARLADLAALLRFSPSEIDTRVAAIRREVLARSPHLREGNFARIATGDLELLFALYDRDFFTGALARALGGNGDGRLRFRLSKRMTSAGGKTFHYPPQRKKPVSTYEIALSTHLLFTNFRPGDPPAQVNGHPCRDRMEALQRVFEHELLHLVELLATGASSCRSARFRDLARRVFGHTEVTHRLVTPRERALADHGLRVGDRVAFTLDGTRHVGFVNRITKRATVLVQDRRGVRYSDGRRYLKFYVPLPRLHKF